MTLFNRKSRSFGKTAYLTKASSSLHVWYDAFVEWNKVMNQERARLYEQLVKSVMRLGYPREFGQQIAGNLRTEKAMSRMIGYLSHFKKISAEEIADEMIAIM